MVFNPVALDDLYDIDEALVPQLVSEFRSIRPQYVQRIAAAMQANDIPNIELNSHSLKSSCQMLGFEKMTEACQKIESAARLGQIEKNLILSLEAGTLEALAAVNQFLIEVDRRISKT